MTESEPMVVYTTAGGQMAGVGAVFKGWGREPLPEQQRQWASTSPLLEPINDPEYAHIDVAFRSGNIVCDGQTGGDTVGDVIIVNPAGPHSKNIPTTEVESESNGWRRGSCFDGMGWHRYLDTSTNDNSLSWTRENVFPVMAMYHEGEVNAIFFASTLNQVSIPLLRVNRWEPKSLTDSEFCGNLCDSDCNFGEQVDGGPWSTMHIYFKDHESVVCDSSLTCDWTWPFRGACCEGQVVGRIATSYSDFGGNDTSLDGTELSELFNDTTLVSSALSLRLAERVMRMLALLALFVALHF